MIIAAVLLLVAGYKLAMQKTFAVISSYDTMVSQIAAANSAEEQLLALKKQAVLFQGESPREVQHTSFQDIMLEQVTGFCNNNDLILRDFPAITSFEENNLTIQVASFTLEGSFPNLVRLSYHLEQNSSWGKVMSARYFLKKNSATKKMELLSTIHIQNIKKEK